MIRILCILGVIVLSDLSSDVQEVFLTEISELNEQDFAGLFGKTVKIRGFLYADSRGRLILDASPNLKSCCRGVSSKIKQQVVIDGYFDSPDHRTPVLLQGTFSVQPAFSADSELIQYAILSDPEMIDESSFREVVILIAIVAMAVVFYQLYMSSGTSSTWLIGRFRKSSPVRLKSSGSSDTKKRV